MIRIMMDSASDCGSGVCDLYVPLTVRVDGKEYRDGVDLTADRFYSLLTAGGEFPKTSQPSPEDFVRHFEKIKADGDILIYFSLSSALSGTYQSARIAREMVDYDGIYLVDTCCVSHLIGILADHAVSLVKKGCSAEQILEECQALKGRIRVYAGVDTLEYLYKGGRLSKTSAAVGELAGIKPVVTVSPEGTVQACAKTIGVPRAVKLIQEKVSKAEPDPAFPVYTLYTVGTDHVEKLEAKLAAAGIAVTERRQVGPTIGAHVGPNVYGVVFVAK